MSKNVTVRRVLRDGSITVERVPSWVADGIVSAMPFGSEPNTAKLRVIVEEAPQPSRFTQRQDVYGLALAMAGQLPGGGILH